MPNVTHLGVIEICATIDNIAYCNMETILVEIIDGLYRSKIIIHFVLWRNLLYLMYFQTYYSVNIRKFKYLIVKHSILTSNSKYFDDIIYHLFYNIEVKQKTIDFSIAKV